MVEGYIPKQGVAESHISSRKTHLFTRFRRSVNKWGVRRSISERLGEEFE